MARSRIRGPDEENLTEFGEWVNTLCTILHSDYHEVGRYASPPMSHSLISRAARNQNGPSRNSVARIWDALYRIAEERDTRGEHLLYLFNHFVRDAFYNAGGRESSDQREQAMLRLQAIRVYRDLAVQNDQQVQVIDLLEEEITLLRQQIKQLRPQN